MIQKLKRTIFQIMDKGFFHILSSNILIQMVGFGSQFFVAWILTPEDLGRIKLLQSYLAIFSILAGFGFNTSVLKLCSEKKSGCEKYFIYKKALIYSIFSIFIAYFLFIVVVKLQLLSQDQLLITIVPIYAIILLPIVLNQIFTSYLQAIKLFKKISYIQIVTKIISLLLIIVLTFFYELNGYIAALIMGFCITAYCFFKTIPRMKVCHEVEKTITFFTHWKIAKYALLANFTGQLGYYLDIILISTMIHDMALIGYFAFAKTAMLVLNIYVSSVQQITTPYFSEKSSCIEEWKTSFIKYQNLFIFSALFFATFSFFAYAPVAHFIFQGKYDQSVPFFKVLCLAWVIRVLFSLKGPALLGLGRINLNFYSVLLSLPFSLLVMYFFIKQFGIYGAAYGTFFQALITYFFQGIFFKRVLNEV